MAKRTQTAIVATPHLRAIDGFEPAMVQPVIERLVAWRPSVIGIEALPTAEIEAMRANPAYAEVLAAFVSDKRQASAARAQALSGLTALEANSSVDGWNNGPGMITPDERRTRMIAALAAFRPETALIYFDEESAEGLAEELRSYLSELAASANERVSLAVAVARALDLAFVSPIDSHLDKDYYLAAIDDLQAGFSESEEAATVTQRPPYTDQDEIMKAAIASKNLMPLYAFLNSSEFGEGDVRGQFDLINRIAFPNGAGHLRQAAWDERNLRIAAHIRRASARRPGERVLVLIGAGHKPFLDQLIAASLDTASVDTPALFVDGQAGS